MSREPDRVPGSRGPVLGPRGLYVLLVVLPLVLAGVAGDLIRDRQARSLAVDEARRMAEAGLALADARGPEEALRTLEGVVGYEAAFYSAGSRILSTDRGFGPATLDRDLRVLELNGRLGVRAEGPELEILAAASAPRQPGATYPGGRRALVALTLAVLFLGLAALSLGPPPSTLRLVLAAGLPVLLAAALLAAAADRASTDARDASARELGLAAALARDLGFDAPVELLARVSGLRVARLKDGRILQASWDARELASRVERLPRPPMSRTITGYLTTREEKLRYAATRSAGETTVFLAPAPELPPRKPALRLLLLGTGIAAAGAAFVFFARES